MRLGKAAETKAYNMFVWHGNIGETIIIQAFAQVKIPANLYYNIFP